MSNLSYQYIPNDSEVLNLIAGVTYICPNCDYTVLINSRNEVFGALAKRTPDAIKIDLVFGHQCTHCQEEVTISHHLPHAFRVWMKDDEVQG